MCTSRFGSFHGKREESCNFKTWPNTWRVGNLKSSALEWCQRHSPDHAFAKWLPWCLLTKLYFQFNYHLTHRSQAQIRPLKICIQARPWKKRKGLKWEQTFKSSSSLADLLPQSFRLIIFLTVWALHSLCSFPSPHWAWVVKYHCKSTEAFLQNIEVTDALKSTATTQGMHFTTSGSMAASPYLSTPQDKPLSCWSSRS